MIENLISQDVQHKHDTDMCCCIQSFLFVQTILDVYNVCGCVNT